MTPAELTAWRKRLKLSRERASEALGISASQLFDYETGRKRGTDRAAPIPKTIALACAAIEAGLTVEETITMTEHARPGYRFYRVVTPSVARENEIPCDADVDLEGEDLVRYSELQELAEAHGTAIESNPYRTL